MVPELVLHFCDPPSKSYDFSNGYYCTYKTGLIIGPDLTIDNAELLFLKNLNFSCDTVPFNFVISNVF